MTLRYIISFGKHTVFIKIYFIFIERYLICPLNIFVFYLFVITVYMLKNTFLRSVYLAPSPAEAPHCSVVFWPRLLRQCSSGFWCLKWMLERMPSGLSNKCKVVQTRKGDECDPQQPAGGLRSIKTPFHEMIECRSVCRGSCRDAAGTQDGLASCRC